MKFSKLTRRSFLLGSSLAGLSYSAFVEPGWLEVNHYIVPNSKSDPSNKSVKILQLSDFHLSACVSLEFINTAIELGLAERPDLIVLTGDFITRKNLENGLEAYSQVLSKLSKSAPCFAIFGNHDGGKWAKRGYGYSDLTKVRELLRQSGIKILYNTSEKLNINNRAIRLFGLGDLWAEELDAKSAFAGAEHQGDEYRIVLSHNPDSKDLLKTFAWDLMLCGHTHGGQVYFPIIGAPFAPVQDKRFIQGLNVWDSRLIFTTKGVGNLHGVRFNCRPEVALLELT